MAKATDKSSEEKKPVPKAVSRAAKLLGRKRWLKMSKEERKQFAAKNGRKAWSMLSMKEREEKVRQLNEGRWRHRKTGRHVEKSEQTEDEKK